MKKFFIFSLAALLVVPAFAGSTKTTTTSTYEETSSSPVMNSDTDMGTGASSEMIEAEEYDQPLSTDEVDATRMDEQEKMEERSSTIIESEDAIDYDDRTRTNRERKALNTGSHASDDE